MSVFKRIARLMNSKAIRYGAVALVLAIAAYWYWSPLLAVHQLQSAAKAGDADTFNDHVDYPRLRESLKGQLTAAFTEHMASQQAPDNDFGKAGAALGAMLGMAMVDKMVDAFVRPETVMRAMQEGKMVPRRPADTASRFLVAPWKSSRIGFRPRRARPSASTTARSASGAR